MNQLIDRSKCAFFTGHRDYTQHFTISAINWMIQAARERGIEHFYTGMAIGVDQHAARVLCDRNLSWTAVIPCNGQDKFWDGNQKRYYQKLLEKAPNSIVLEQEYSNGCMLRRNEWMVDHSAMCLAFFDRRKSTGGTYHAVSTARKAGLCLIGYDPAANHYGVTTGTNQLSIAV